jgi:hypothetical protein
VTRESLQIRTVDLQPSSGLPAHFTPSMSPELDQLTSLLGQLVDKHCFAVGGARMYGGAVAHVLLGRLKGDSDSSGWVGLLGVGVSAD